MTRNPYAPPDAPVADSAIDTPTPEGWRNARVLATHFAVAAAIVVAAAILINGYLVDHSEHPFRYPTRRQTPVAALFFGFMMFVWSWLVSAVATRMIRAATPGSRWGGLFHGAFFALLTIALGNAFDSWDASFGIKLLVMVIWTVLYPSVVVILLVRRKR